VCINFFLSKSPILFLKAPEPRTFSELPYCLQNQTSYNGFPNYQCMYFQDNLVMYPRTEESAMQASTRITQQNMAVFCDFSTPDCAYNVTSTPQTVFTADIERFTVRLTSWCLTFSISFNSPPFSPSAPD